LGYYSELSLNEKYPILHKTNFIVQWFEDFTVPFVQIVKSNYNMVYAFADDIHYTSKIELKSSSETKMANLILQKNNYIISLNSNGFDKIEILENNKKTIALCEAQ
jgi:enolase